MVMHIFFVGSEKVRQTSLECGRIVLAKCSGCGTQQKAAASAIKGQHSDSYVNRYKLDAKNDVRAYN